MIPTRKKELLFYGSVVASAEVSVRKRSESGEHPLQVLVRIGENNGLITNAAGTFDPRFVCFELARILQNPISERAYYVGKLLFASKDVLRFNPVNQSLLDSKSRTEVARIPAEGVPNIS